MSAERFFDDLARTLAEPMPRRRAVRVIGASLAAVAVPGISPRAARATATSRSQKPPPPCPRGNQCCYRTPYDPQGQIERIDCGFPAQRYDCDGPKCLNTCPPTNGALKNPDGTPKRQEATWSSAKNPDGTPKRYECCPVPDYLPRDGECLPNCKAVLGPRAIQCGKYCCPPGHRCKGKGQCIPCPRGQEGCGTACCKPGKVCRPCIDGSSDFSRPRELNGKERCCAPDEKCCGSTCCKRKDTHCCGSLCCSLSTPCAMSRGRDVCCPKPRALWIDGQWSCCPVGTVAVSNKGCCPPGDRDCCPPRDALGNVLNCSSLARICVNGACVNP